MDSGSFKLQNTYGKRIKNTNHNEESQSFETQEEKENYEKDKEIEDDGREEIKIKDEVEVIMLPIN